VKNVWLGIGFAVFLVLVLFYISSAQVQKLRSDSAISSIVQTA